MVGHPLRPALQNGELLVLGHIVEQTHKLPFETLPLLDELEASFSPDGYHLGPDAEVFKHSRGQQVDEGHELPHICQIGRQGMLRKGFQLHIQRVLNGGDDMLLLGLFGEGLGLLSLVFLAEKPSQNALLLLRFLGDGGLLADDLLFLPGGEVGDDLGVRGQEVVVLEVLRIPIFDSFEDVEVRIEVAADAVVGLSGQEGQLVVPLEEGRQHAYNQTIYIVVDCHYYLDHLKLKFG